MAGAANPIGKTAVKTRYFIINPLQKILWYQGLLAALGSACPLFFPLYHTLIDLEQKENIDGVMDKLAVLADAAKYDASCASSGSNKTRDGKGLSSVKDMGFATLTPDGRCVSLLKILLTILHFRL